MSALAGRDQAGSRLEPEPSPAAPRVPASAAHERLGRISRTIKPPIQGASYISFLFRERGKIREFGRRTHVLETGVWPPGLSMSPHLTGFLTRDVAAWAAELSSRLAPVLEQGWLHLTHRQYNLVALLKRLVDLIQVFDFPRLNMRDRNAIERLRRIESLFLMFHYDQQDIGTVLTALRIYHEKQHDAEDEAEKSGGLIIRILSEDCTLPSFYNCLIGLNMLKTRRFLTLADLTRSGLGDMVDTGDFDAEDRVQERITSFLEEALGSTREMHTQLQEARRVNSYITIDDAGNPLTDPLWDVYKAGESHRPADFDADQDNMVPFLSRLMRGFDKVFSPLLNGQCVLPAGGRVSIFSRSFFDLDFSRLRTQAGKLENGEFQFASFPLDRFLRIKHDTREFGARERETCQLIEESVGCLVDIGKTIAKVLGLRSPQAAPGGLAEPLQPLVLKGKAFSIPHENDRIPAMGGRTVAEALSAAVNVCFTAGALFQDDFLMLFLGKEKRLEAELAEKMKLVENLLDPETWRKLAADYT